MAMDNPSVAMRLPASRRAPAAVRQDNAMPANLAHGNVAHFQRKANGGVADNPGINRTGVQRFRQRRDGRKLRPLDVVVQVLQLIRGFKLRAHTALLIGNARVTRSCAAAWALSASSTRRRGKGFSFVRAWWLSL